MLLQLDEDERESISHSQSQSSFTCSRGHSQAQGQVQQQVQANVKAKSTSACQFGIGSFQTFWDSLHTKDRYFESPFHCLVETVRDAKSSIYHNTMGACASAKQKDPPNNQAANSQNNGARSSDTNGSGNRAQSGNS